MNKQAESLMLDTITPHQQRSKGIARVALGRDGNVVDLFQQGSAKAILPRVHSEVPEVVFLNTSGGLTGGDSLRLGLEIAAGTTVTAATQTAERAYASSGGQAKVDVEIRVGEDAFCLWMPQETILFEASSLSRKTLVSLAKGATFLGVETLVLGRAAMGETAHTLNFEDLRLVTDSQDKPLHAEQIALSQDRLTRRKSKAGLAGKTVFASLVYIAPDAEDHLARVRQLAGGAGVASAWKNRLVLRIESHDSWNVRCSLIPIIKALSGCDVPRVWQT